VAKTLGGKNASSAPPTEAATPMPPEPPAPAPEQATNAAASEAGQETPAPKPEKTAQTKALPTLLELGSQGCMPCRYMAPIIDALEKELAGKVTVKFYDVNENPGIADKYQIQVIPTQIFLDAEGKELFRHVGVFEKEEILAKLKELGMLKE